MHTFLKGKTLRIILGVALSIALFYSSGVKVPGLDSTAEAYFKDSIAKAGVSYGVCRIINGTVSVIQQSTVQLEPAGIGMSLAVGQIVDPINDMVERLSDVLVLSITSLGVQEIMYEMGVVLAPPVIAVLVLLLSLAGCSKSERLNSLQKVIMNLVIIILVGRCCLSVSSLANEFLHEHFFEDKIIEANAKLYDSTVHLDTIEDIEIPEYNGMIKTIENSAKYLKSKTVEFKNAVAIVVENKGLIIENLLKLTFLYLGIFFIQVLLLPLLVFWLMMKTVNALFFQRL
jgi:hypothetical protein